MIPVLNGSPEPKKTDAVSRTARPGNGEEEIGEPHEQVVDLSAVVAGDGADGRADERGEDGDHDGDPERRPDAEHDPAQVVAAELVGAEQVPALERRASEPSPRG